MRSTNDLCRAQMRRSTLWATEFAAKYGRAGVALASVVHFSRLGVSFVLQFVLPPFDNTKRSR
jgi:hypothetical protein